MCSLSGAECWMQLCFNTHTLLTRCWCHLLSQLCSGCLFNTDSCQYFVNFQKIVTILSAAECQVSTKLKEFLKFHKTYTALSKFDTLIKVLTFSASFSQLYLASHMTHDLQNKASFQLNWSLSELMGNFGASKL